MKQLIGAALTAGALLSGAQTFAADCGKVVIGEMNWASGEFLARLDGFILSEGYGCDVEYLTAGTVPQITSMNEKGVPHFASELWANASKTLIDAAEAEGRLTRLNTKPIDGAGEGWWIDPKTMEKHGLKTVDDVLARPDLFPHPEDPSKGGFHTCPAGWGCELANANLFRAFDMESKGWKFVQPGSGAGLDGSIAKAGERGQAWFGYYWAPTTMIGKYELQPVDFASDFDAENWNNCIVLPVEDCKSPQRSRWTVSEVVSLAQQSFVKDKPAAAAYVKARSLTVPELGKYLKYMDANQAPGDDAAIEFLLNEEAVWTKWVSADAAAKIKKAL